MILIKKDKIYKVIINQIKKRYLDKVYFYRDSRFWNNEDKKGIPFRIVHIKRYKHHSNIILIKYKSSHIFTQSENRISFEIKMYFNIKVFFIKVGKNENNLLLVKQ